MKQLDRNAYFGDFKQDVMKRFGEQEGKKVWAKAYAPAAGEKARDKMAKITALPGFPWLVWKNRVAIMKNAGSSKKGYTSKIVGVSKESVTMYIYSCPIHEALKELQMEEIAPVMCAIDKISTTGIRGVCYHRKMSVAEGDAYCDYYITRA